MTWLPIETAPKDGTAFLVFLADEGFSTLANYDRREGMWFLPAHDIWQDADALHQMSHWMPLPEPPRELP